MKRIIYALALLAYVAPAWAQSDVTATEVLDRVSIFSQDRSPAQLGESGVGPRGAAASVELSPDRLIFAGVVIHESLSEALLEVQSPGGPQFQMVHEGDLAGGFRVEKITPQHVQVSDGAQSYVMDLGRNLLNQERQTPTPASPTSRPRQFGRSGLPLMPAAH